jgi:hypothetical protein
MRIWLFILIHLFSLNVFAATICGLYKVQGYVPEKAQGKEIHVNPKSVTSTKLNVKSAVPKEYWGRVIEIETTFSNLCLLSCDVSEYKILRAISPFEKLMIFNHDQTGLIKKVECLKSFIEFSE